MIAGIRYAPVSFCDLAPFGKLVLFKEKFNCRDPQLVP